MDLFRAVESAERGELDMERAQWLNQLCECFLKAGVQLSEFRVYLLPSH